MPTPPCPTVVPQPCYHKCLEEGEEELPYSPSATPTPPRPTQVLQPSFHECPDDEEEDEDWATGPSDVVVVQTSSAIDSLPNELEDASLQRGVSLATLFEHAGAHLKAQTTITEEQAIKLYAKSWQVERISRFISHSWKDGHHGKILALLLSENMLGMMMAPMVVSISLCVLQTQGYLPRVQVEVRGSVCQYFPWCFLGGAIALFTSLFTSHHVTARTRYRKSYFFDRLCIHQFDESRKKDGVLSLASFVANTDKLIILWTPIIFDRLWCVLEVAALAQKHTGEQLPLVFLPLQLAKLSFSAYCIVFLAYFLYAINRLMGNVLPVFQICVVFLSICFMLLANSLRKYSREVRFLKSQLCNFKVESAQCSVEEDRRLVNNTIRQWFGSLEAFNELVRTTVAKKVVSAVGPKLHFPLKFSWPIVLLDLVYELDFIGPGSFWDQLQEDRLLQEVCGSISWLLMLSTLMPASLQISQRAAKRHKPYWKDFGMTGLVTVFAILYGVLAFASPNIFLRGCSSCPSYVVILATLVTSVWAVLLNSSNTCNRASL